MHRPTGLPGFLLTCSILLSPIFLSPIFAATPGLANSATELAFSPGLELPNARSIDPIVGEMFPRWTSVRIYLNGEHSGESDLSELTAWARSIQDQPVTSRLRAINQRVNRLLSYSTDMQLWHETDYWETPAESVARGAADCEGYAILKMYLAKEAGISLDQMAVLVGTLGNARTPHAILGANVGRIVVTLDNKNGAIVALNDRSDFTPIYSIGVRGAYTYPMNWSAIAGKPSYSYSPPVAMTGISVTSADSNAHPIQPASAPPTEVVAKSEPATAAAVADSSDALPLPLPPIKPAMNRKANTPPAPVVAEEPATVVTNEETPEDGNRLFGGGLGDKLEQVVSFLLR